MNTARKGERMAKRNYISVNRIPKSYMVFHCTDCNSITKIYWLCCMHSFNIFLFLLSFWPIVIVSLKRKMVEILVDKNDEFIRYLGYWISLSHLLLTSHSLPMCRIRCGRCEVILFDLVRSIWNNVPKFFYILMISQKKFIFFFICWLVSSSKCTQCC